MLRNQILSAEKPADLFGATVDEAELKEYANNLRNLFAPADPNRQEAVEKIESLLKQRSFDVARVIPNGLKVRKSPYGIHEKVGGAERIIVHAATDKRGAKRSFIFAATPAMNSTVMQSNDNIETIRASVTKRNRASFPEVMDTFFLSSKSGHKLLATIHNTNGATPLADLKGKLSDDQIANFYSDMIETLRKTHEAGIVHGACFTDAWVVDPVTGKLILTDWKYSVQAGEKMWKLPEALVNEGLYLSKTVNSGIPNGETDIRLASYAAYILTGDGNAPWLRKYLKSMGDYPFDSAKKIAKEFADTFRNRKLGLDEGTLLPN